MQKIKITELDLVKLYGTNNQIKKYIENGKFVSNQKKTILNKAALECSIKDNGDRTYTINKVYKVPYPKIWNKMNTSLYQYIIPLILNKLISTEERSLFFTSGKWARMIEMVNSNYKLLKYNTEEALDYVQINTNIEKRDVLDFYDRADHSINNYIANALKYLKDCGCIEWNEGFQIIKQEIIYNEDGTYEFNTITESATKEDKEYRAECIQIADEIAEIVGQPEKRKHSKIWNETYTKELRKHGIELMYPVFEIYKVHNNLCEDILSLYNSRTEKTLIRKLTTEFMNILIDNANKRYNNNEYLNEKMSPKEYELIYSQLSNLTINPKAKDLSKYIKDLTGFKYYIRTNNNKIVEIKE